MFSYCLKRKIILKVLIAKFLQLAMVKKTILSKCAICGSKKSTFIKKQEAK